MPQDPIVNAGLKYVNGLGLDRTDDENITIAAGACRDSTNTIDMVVSSALTVDILESGAGGLDAGSVAASTRYAVYLIGDSTKHNDPAGLFSTDFSEPSLPAGYDSYRRIGCIFTDGSSDILEFHQYGNGQERAMYYDVGIAELTNGTATSFTAVDVASSVPPIATQVILDVAYTPDSATNTAHFLPFGSSATNGIVRFGYGVAAAQRGMATVPLALDSSVPKFLYKVDNGSDDLDILVAGYIDVLV